MNLLTFDIEEWYLNLQKGGPKERYVEFDHYLEVILNKLEERKLKATFFCVGEMGRSFPEVIKKIHEQGHEIGCHSNNHTWLNKMTKDELFDDTHRAIDSLEQCIGEKIDCYRAPAFSIGKANPWAFEVLASCGIEIDASIFPAERDYGGFSAYREKGPSIIKYKGISIREFPISTITIIGKEFAYSGGGYFRLYPLPFITSQLKRHSYSMVYLHIADITENKRSFQSRDEYESYFNENGSLLSRMKRYVKGNIGKKGALAKLESLLSGIDFVSIKEADKMIDWHSVPEVTLDN